MENGQQLIQEHCLNCTATIEGDYCHVCGQSARENTDRSLVKLMGEVLGNLFFLDNRFFLSVQHLFLLPGKMTVEFLAGKRKKFISPVTLFLFLNLIYFFVNPLSDYSISLEDQFYSQPYSDWAQDWIKEKLVNEKIAPEDYSITFQNSSDSISKAIMIINVPMIALVVFLLSFKRRRFYYDSLIFAFHFFSFFIASWIMLDWVDELITLLAGHEESIAATVSFYLFAFGLPLLYAILSIKKFLALRWYWAIPIGMIAMISVTMVNMVYRFIILVLTLWMT